MHLRRQLSVQDGIDDGQHVESEPGGTRLYLLVLDLCGWSVPFRTRAPEFSPSFGVSVCYEIM